MVGNVELEIIDDPPLLNVGPLPSLASPFSNSSVPTEIRTVVVS